MHGRCSLLRSITPSVTSLTCTRVFLEFRGLFLHSGTESPPPYVSGTSSSYRDNPGDDRKGYLGGSLRRDHRNLSLDLFVSDPGGTTGQSTSTGAYAFTTFGNTAVEMGVSPDGRLTAGPSRAQSPYGQSALNNDRHQFGPATGNHDPQPTFPHESNIQRQFEEGRGEDNDQH